MKLAWAFGCQLKISELNESKCRNWRAESTEASLIALLVGSPCQMRSGRGRDGCEASRVASFTVGTT